MTEAAEQDRISDLAPISEPAPTPRFRNRIKELRLVKASEIVRNPKNWRRHTTQQAETLLGILSDVGWAAAGVVRELEDGRVMLIDGELRSDTADTEDIPVLVLDVNEDEADKLLAVLDPIAGMAKTDNRAYEELLTNLSSQNEALESLLRSKDSGEVIDRLKVPIPVEAPRWETMSGQKFRIRDRHILVVCDVIRDWHQYTPYLKGDALFVPYAGPLVPFTKLAQQLPLVMVQPVTYVAAIMLDWIEDAFGTEAIAIL
jgi:hypothetical protein